MRDLTDKGNGGDRGDRCTGSTEGTEGMDEWKGKTGGRSDRQTDGPMSKLNLGTFLPKSQ